ncbi:MAG: LLM class flavin-dependent oxidoreductase [Hyphomicrobiaceae bacterium]|nr:LLM class flavin-dependent oxidoreductase [Hyphomicrobiaceae bacterium]
METLRLSVLDQSVAVVDRPHGQSIRDTVALAQVCETLGYHRFWLSEHHNHASIAGSAPEILIAAIAGVTRRIRVGSAGVMLPHYSPLHVAEQFLVLEALAPGRIDLGLGRAPGSDGRTAFALNPLANQRPNEFPADVRDLLAWVSGQPLLEGHPYRQVKAHPLSNTAPEVWMLGSSDYGAQVAAHFGLPYAFAWFFTDGKGGPEALNLYRRLYQPSARHPESHTALCVWALAADTEEEARFQFLPRARVRLLRDSGRFVPLEPPSVAAAHPYTQAERARVERMHADSFVGTGPHVAERIRELATRLDVEEMVVVTWAYDEGVRHKSYRLIAEAMGLGGGHTLRV